MPMGDSITNGVGATGGYRLELKDLMVPRGTASTMSALSPPGHSRSRTASTRAATAARSPRLPRSRTPRSTTYTPNVVLLLIGTNDVTTDTELDNAPARLAG